MSDRYTWPGEWFFLDPASGEIVNVVSNATREQADRIAETSAVPVTVTGSVPMDKLRRYERGGA